jgi:hypothetical protein
MAMIDSIVKKLGSAAPDAPENELMMISQRSLPCVRGWGNVKLMLLYFTFIDVICALSMPLDTQLHSRPIPPKNRF